MSIEPAPAVLDRVLISARSARSRSSGSLIVSPSRIHLASEAKKRSSRRAHGGFSPNLQQIGNNGKSERRHRLLIESSVAGCFVRNSPVFFRCVPRGGDGITLSARFVFHLELLTKRVALAHSCSVPSWGHLPCGELSFHQVGN